MGMMRRYTANSISRYVENFLSAECTITRAVERRDIHGAAAAPDRQTIAEGVPCRVITSKGGAMAQATRIGNRESLVDIYRLILPLDTDIKQNDLVIMGGAAYQVASIDDKLTDRVFKAVLLTRERDRNGG